MEIHNINGVFASNPATAETRNAAVYPWKGEYRLRDEGIAMVQSNG